MSYLRARRAFSSEKSDRALSLGGCDVRVPFTPSTIFIVGTIPPLRSRVRYDTTLADGIRHPVLTLLSLEKLERVVP